MAASPSKPKPSDTRTQNFERLIAAGREIATEGSYRAVTMDAVAKRAGLSRKTTYKYFDNKDHLLAEIVRLWAEEILCALKQQRQTGRTLASRLSHRFVFIINSLHQSHRLLEAVLASTVSPSDSAVQAMERITAVIPSYFGPILEQIPAAKREAVIRTVGYLFHAILISVSTRRRNVREAIEDFDAALHLLLDQN